jgi:hypothetical protein
MNDTRTRRNNLLYVALAQLPTTECVLWPGVLDRAGYARARLYGRKWVAHRAVYTLVVGPVPDDLTLDHLCRVRHCVNPAHLGSR